MYVCSYSKRIRAQNLRLLEKASNPEKTVNSADQSKIPTGRKNEERGGAVDLVNRGGFDDRMCVFDASRCIVARGFLSFIICLPDTDFLKSPFIL